MLFHLITGEFKLKKILGFRYMQEKLENDPYAGLVEL